MTDDDSLVPPIPPERLVKRPIARQIGHRFSNGSEAMPPPDFSEVLSLFSDYRNRTRGAGAPLTDWIAEAETRLEQVAFLCRRIEALQRRYGRLRAWSAQDSQARRGRVVSAGKLIGDRVDLDTHCFYYLALRLCKIIEHRTELRFNTPEGIRNVRNWLIEHPEKSGASAVTFAWGEDLPWGPIIKPFGARRDGAQHHDDGLYVNARQLIDRLVSALRHANRAERD